MMIYVIEDEKTYKRETVQGRWTEFYHTAYLCLPILIAILYSIIRLLAFTDIGLYRGRDCSCTTP